MFLFFYVCVFIALQVIIRELATAMECNLCSLMKTLQEICGSDLQKGNWQKDFGEAKKWDEEGDFEAGWGSEGKGLWRDKREAKWPTPIVED